jgi:hypothetical protein
MGLIVEDLRMRLPMPLEASLRERQLHAFAAASSRPAQPFFKGRALGGGAAPARICPISNLFRIKAWWPLGFAFLVTLLVELALVERKYAIFGGGFGSSHVIDRAGEFLLFASSLALTQSLVVALLYLIIRALHRRRRQHRAPRGEV